jgi:hypothetical protein
MSTPLVAGSAALVREWLMTEGANLTPSAALLKALLIHGAAPLGTTAHPNTESGWGRADVARTLGSSYAVIDDDQVGISTGTTRVYHLQVVDTDEARNLAATLTWTDPPSHSAAAQTLVNNLDLTVEAPDGTRWFGNGGSAPDTRNNVETVRLDTLAAGTYTIRVHADNVVGTYGPQPFALLVSTKTDTSGTEPRQQIPASSSTIFLPFVAR